MNRTQREMVEALRAVVAYDNAGDDSTELLAKAVNLSRTALNNYEGRKP